eukprot:CAMPEP_0196598586 /NCGR_PEP_ID=MMETSP1081-20130531/94402_1 /TAXON_ID=36882 /ORGANISM="Pyramimonas amylifera, Strain CCMP720" /LENGTH=713 /DNA_ID=CAMNT_0041924299 /DNA_START=49 /DNA_END=2191 /DNA_ORIENTATION=+
MPSSRMTTAIGTDPSSFANLHEVRVKHINMDLDVRFDTKTIDGFVQLDATIEETGACQLCLDTRDLTLHQVVLMEGENVGGALEYKVAEETKALGSKLTVKLPSSLSKGDSVRVGIKYSTSPTCTAVQFLDPKQTAEGTHPYLFSQCQAIHARSLLPCQDTPGAKMSYSATVWVPEELTALMSAIPVDIPQSETTAKGHRNGSVAKKAFSFEQKVPIPSYLLALAAGKLESREIGPRSRVWSEASMVAAGEYEFADTEKYLVAAESIAGDYVWGRYDILLLPPSFPYGGMENPCLTFVTPTLLAGDRSQANVIAHEIAHSWCGNLVTNRTWEHFWMNEGFTVFLERKILGRMSGEPTLQFHALSGLRNLESAVQSFGDDAKGYTQLVPDLSGGGDPDDAFSKVPYEKGFNFLYYLQTTVGGGKSVFGEPMLQFHALSGLTDLGNEIKSFGEDPKGYTQLIPNLSDGGDPDDAFSTVPYEKGFNFLYYLQTTVGGGKNFEPFFQKFIQNHAYGTVDTDTFKADFLKHFSDVKAVENIDWKEWLYGKGMPPVENQFDQALALQAKALSEKWHFGDVLGIGSGSFEEQSTEDMKEWPGEQVVAFLESLHSLRSMKPLHSSTAATLDSLYKLSSSKNSEILFAWFKIAIHAEYTPALPALTAFLTKQGRMKYVRPLYRALFASKMGKQIALDTFKTHCEEYHPIAKKMLTQDLQLSN